MTPPMAPLPSVMISMNAFRSRLNAIARRRSGLSKGGVSRLISKLRLTFAETSSQIACGAALLKSFRTGIVTPMAMSLFPAMNARFRVETSGIIGYSIPSR
jgi:hypothetical protein